MKLNWVSEQAIEIFRDSLSHYQRVLILGASGWFGQTAVYLLRGFSGQALLVGSRARLVRSPGSDFLVNSWDSKEVEEFEPDLVLDFSYLLPDWAIKMGEDRYLQSIREFESRLEWLLLLPSLRGLLTISSGAALEKNPEAYGASKRRLEQMMQEAASRVQSNIAVMRVWSVSGGFVVSPLKYALSGFVQNGLSSREIHVDSEIPVFRRYCAVEEVLATGLNSLSLRKFALIESGGPKVELRDLAALVCRILGGRVTVQAPQVSEFEGPQREYCSDNYSWTSETRALGLSTLDLEHQVGNVVEALRARP